MVSIIIPVYNEEKIIADCLSSLTNQTYKPLEVIVIDDGSTDQTAELLSNYQLSITNYQLLRQTHSGPAVARNLGAKKANGEILVFVDADMTFDNEFIKNLTEPILKGESKGTFTKEEYVSNWNNVWARCWNYNEGLTTNRRISKDYPHTSPVFRAILKSEFDKVKGFDDIGFTDDWTLSRKLGYKATIAPGAICYHKNPETLKEVYIQARWVGKNEFISGKPLRRLLSLIRYNNILQSIRGIYISIKHKEILFLLFQVVYYYGIWISVMKSFFGEEKNK